MSKSFLITSHTEGAWPFEQGTMLRGLVKALKHYFPDCFIVVTSQSSVDAEVQRMADSVIIDRVTPNFPHGAGELVLIDHGIRMLKQFGKTDFYKICYDFIIDDTNYTVFDRLISHGKDFASCYWRAAGLGVGTWLWYSTIDMHEKVFDFETLNRHLECTVLESIQNKGLLDKCWIYFDEHEMLDGDWNSRCDLVHQAGLVLKHTYGSLLVAVELTDSTESYVPSVLLSLALQSKMINHLVIVDRRTKKTDLRQDDLYQDLLTLLVNKGISWNLIFDVDTTIFKQHLEDLGHTWCVILENNKLLDLDLIKRLYERIVLTQNIGTILDKEGHLLYKNKVIDSEGLNTDIRQYVVDKFKETCYNNINC